MTDKPKRPSRNPLGRTPIPVDEKLLDDLASICATDTMIAKILRIHMNTLHRRYGERVDAKRQAGQSKILWKLWEIAQDDHHKDQFNAIKLLAYKYLGFSDKVEHSGNLTLEALVAGVNQKSQQIEQNVVQVIEESHEQ